MRELARYCTVREGEQVTSTAHVETEPASVPVSAFIPSAMRYALEASATKNERSLSGELRVALAEYLAAEDVPLNHQRRGPQNGSGDSRGGCGT